MTGQLPITREQVFNQRRLWLKGMASAGIMGGLAGLNFPVIAATKQSVTPYSLATNYNNYYEFTSNKKMVKHIAKDFTISPWSLTINGLVDKPISLTMADLMDVRHVSRTYKLRCVEGWSAIIPWQGIELSRLLSLVKPLANAKYVKFVSKLDPSEMIGQRGNQLPWPYVEGLRLDEALHPLTLLATTMYDKPLAKQNGAPIRLVVPWKYGYKSIKAVTQIELVEQQPISSWQQQVPSEYGFYANVNPQIPHPRWSQRREVLLGQTKKIKTQMLNGYANELIDLYQHDDLSSLI